MWNLKKGQVRAGIMLWLYATKCSVNYVMASPSRAHNERYLRFEGDGIC
jgi:hypothetical protein